MAYGRGAGQTFELFEVTGPGNSHIHQFFEQHGEGVNHLGLWCEDVTEAARRSVEGGAELLSLTADAEGNATAQLIPGRDVKAEHWQALGLVTFVNPSGGVLIEYVGKAGEAFLRDWFKEDFENVVVGPPWLAQD
jgi:4-hydroxyphenylpyruvate dioxygenase-like putative hemolysin